jgi:hypothetical protein
MAREGYKILDSDMHVYEPHDLYLKYMDPKWGNRIPRGGPRKRHGQIKFTLANGKPLRPSGTEALSATSPKKNEAEAAPGEVAHRDVLKRIGDDNVVISTDYPHADSHWPDAMNHFMALEMPSSSRRKILWDNCARLYGVQ